MNTESSGYEHLPDEALLRKLIGARQVRALYRGRLQPLFTSMETGPPNEKCAVARELVRRWLTEELQARCALSAPESVRDYLKLHFAGRERESFVVLYLDAQNRLIAAEELFQGTLTQTSVYPREIIKGALRHNAASAIFAHNHPSGVAEPSHADQSLTGALKQALSHVDVKVLDHFVIAGSRTMSFAERGLL